MKITQITLLLISITISQSYKCIHDHIIKNKTITIINDAEQH